MGHSHILDLIYDKKISNMKIRDMPHFRFLKLTCYIGKPHQYGLLVSRHRCHWHLSEMEGHDMGENISYIH